LNPIQPPSSLADSTIESQPNEGQNSEPRSKILKRLTEIAKIVAILGIMFVACWLVFHKLEEANVTVEKVQEGISNVPAWQIALALGLTALNYLILTGYDFIAIRHLRKSLPVSKIMTGAIVGYSYGNVLGWLLGGNAVRYRLYSTWGFSLIEIVAFVTILATTFWLGLFLLAGVAFIWLPVKLTPDVQQKLMLDHQVWGWIFLASIATYLIACTFYRKPIRFRDFEVTLPPFRLSAMQLTVSAGDFLLASLVLYWLIPHQANPDINFSTILVAYLTGQIITVLTHVPGGYGILELTLFSFFPAESRGAVVAAVVLFRVIYYFLPFIPATLLVLYNEVRVKHRIAEAKRQNK